MISFLQQAGAVAALNIKSLPRRPAMALSAVLAAALAVAVLLACLALRDGFRNALRGSGSDDAAIILASGPVGISVQQVRLLEQAPGVAGRVGAVSPEIYLAVAGERRDSGLDANLTLRGLTAASAAARANVHLVKGRLFQSGRNELVVGHALQQQFSGFELGNNVQFGASSWVVVGVFEAGGSVFESELWADAPVVQTQFRRGASFDLVRIGLESKNAFERFAGHVRDDPRLGFSAQPERAYYANQSGAIDRLVRYIGLPVALLMGLGALAAGLNTMYASVAARAREIATLRLIGFSGASALCGIVFESLALALIGAALGLGLFAVSFDGMTASTLGQGFSQILFRIDVTWPAALLATLMALAIGLLGGLLPGLRAASRRIDVATGGQ